MDQDIEQYKKTISVIEVEDIEFHSERKNLSEFKACAFTIQEDLAKA